MSLMHALPIGIRCICGSVPLARDDWQRTLIDGDYIVYIGTNPQCCKGKEFRIMVPRLLEMHREPL